MIPCKARLFLTLALAVLATGLLAAEDEPPSLPQIAVAPVSLEQYIAELDRLSTIAAEMRQPKQVLKVQAELPREWAVQTPSGIVEVSTGRIRDLLERWQGEASNRDMLAGRIQKELAAMRHQAQNSRTAGQGPSSGAARSKLTEILKGREFSSVSGPSAWDEFWAKVRDWMGRLLDKIFGRMRISQSAGSMISWTVITAAFVVVVWLIVRNLLAQSRGFSLHLEAPAEKHQSSWEWLKAARRAADAGDFREAIHSAYWAAVYRLGEAGVWRLDATRTPREYLRLLRAERPEWPPMSEITRNFEVVWYGDRPASERNFQTAVEGLEKLGCHLP